MTCRGRPCHLADSFLTIVVATIVVDPDGAFIEVVGLVYLLAPFIAVGMASIVKQVNDQGGAVDARHAVCFSSGLFWMSFGSGKHLDFSNYSFLS